MSEFLILLGLSLAVIFGSNYPHYLKILKWCGPLLTMEADKLILPVVIYYMFVLKLRCKFNLWILVIVYAYHCLLPLAVIVDSIWKNFKVLQAITDDGSRSQLFIIVLWFRYNFREVYCELQTSVAFGGNR